MLKRYAKYTFLLLFFCSFLQGCSDKGILQKESAVMEEINRPVADEDLKIPVAQASGILRGEPIKDSLLKLSYDDNRETVFRGQIGGENPASFLYEFKDDEVMDYCVYYPYALSGGYYAAWGEVEVYIRESGAALTDFKKIGAKNLGFANLPATFYFEGSKKINGVKFVVKSGQQGWAGISEVKFYRRSSSLLDVLTLFKDKSCSELKAGVTKSMIMDFKNPFYQRIALALLDNSYPKEFRIQQYKAYPNPSIHARQNLINGFSLYENVTGISVNERDTLRVLVGDIPRGEFVSLMVLDWAAKEGPKNRGTYPLHTGENTIEVSSKGLVYLMYHSENFAALSPVKVHFTTGNVNGYFDIAKHKPEDWRRITENAKYELFDVIGKRSQITFSTSDFRAYCSDPYALMAVYDEMVDLAESYTGLKKYNRTLTNRMYVHYHNGTGGGMSAAENHINWNNSKSLTIPLAVKAAELRMSSWGPVHELGHELQTRPGRHRYDGMLEVTNNLLSIFVQLHCGGESRLYNSISAPKTGYQSEFERAMTYYQAGGRVHNYNMDGVRTVLTKLIPLWQLSIYCDKVLEKDWFKDYYQRIYTEPYVGENGAAQMQVIRVFCDVAQLNLLDFFEKSGFLTPTDDFTDKGEKTRFKITEQMIAEVRRYVNSKGYPTPQHNLWYLTDQAENIKCFRDKLTVAKGTGNRKGNSFRLTGAHNAVAYEVYNGDELIFVTPHQEFIIPENTELNNVKVYGCGATGDKALIKLTNNN